MIYLNRANACPTKSEVFSSRPNFWGIFIDFRIKKEPVVYLVDLSHGGGLGVNILPGFGVLLIEVLLWSQYQPVEFASDLVFTITWTKTRKFLKRRFSKRPDKLISNAIQAKSILIEVKACSAWCLPIRSEVSASFSSAGTWSTMMLISWVLMVMTINLWYLARLAHDIAALNRLELQVSGHPWNRHWPLYI